MKFAIVSDTHDNIANFTKVINWLNKEGIKLILHCGDISTQATITEAEKIFEGEIKYARGNADYGLDDIPDKNEVEVESGNPSEISGRFSRKIAICHFPDMAKKLCQSKNYDLVFYGHTHKPWAENENGCKMINPGEMAGQFYRPSFAVYDTEMDNLELKIIDQL